MLETSEPTGPRGRTKSPIGAAGLNQTLSKFKSIDLNLIHALGNKRQNSQTESMQRSLSANAIPAAVDRN